MDPHRPLKSDPQDLRSIPGETPGRSFSVCRQGETVAVTFLRQGERQLLGRLHRGNEIGNFR